jgi:type I restriction enzyme M protein
MSTPTAPGQLWNYCNNLRDDGLSYGDYVEQLTFLLFLKMADELAEPPFNRPSAFPKGFGWDADPEAAFEQFATITEDLKK